MDLVRRVGFTSAYSFRYSARPGTPGSLLPNRVPETVASERLHALQALLQDQATAFNRAMIGQRMDVLFDRPGKHPGQLLGRSPWMQPVVTEDPALAIGDLVVVTITGATASSLTGVPDGCREAA